MEYAHGERHSENEADNEYSSRNATARSFVGGDKASNKKTHDSDVPSNTRMMKFLIILEEKVNLF